MPSTTLFTTLVALLGSTHLASAHMEMLFPPPLRSQYNSIAKAAGDVDYDMTKPLSPDAYPCKGYHTKYAGTDMAKSVATFEPGSKNNFTITGGANHNGGSCQASLSYDQGKTFTVLQSIEGGCPGQGESSFDFTIPDDAKSGEALFAWTWFNKVGNREMYMNCASVTIGGGGSAKRSELAERAAFNSRPQIMVANVGNSCTTADNKDVKFPNPGPDVESGASGDFAAPEGDCGSTGGSGGGGSDSGSSSSAPAEGSGGAEPTTTPTSQAATSTAAATTASLPSGGGVFVTVGDSSTAPAGTEPTTLATSTKPSSATNTQASGAPAGTGTPGSGGGSAFAAGTPCTDEGAWNCIGGSSFQRCASGAWSAEIPMAAGTSCKAGSGDTLVYARRVPRGGARKRLSAWA